MGSRGSAGTGSRPLGPAGRSGDRRGWGPSRSSDASGIVTIARAAAGPGDAALGQGLELGTVGRQRCPRLALSPDAQRLLVAGHGVAIVETAGGGVLAHRSDGADIMFASFVGPTAEAIVVGRADGSVDLLDGSLDLALLPHPPARGAAGAVTALAVAPQGLIAVAPGTTIEVMTESLGRRLALLSEHTAEVASLPSRRMGAFSPLARTIGRSSCGRRLRGNGSGPWWVTRTRSRASRCRLAPASSSRRVRTARSGSGTKPLAPPSALLSDGARTLSTRCLVAQPLCTHVTSRRRGRELGSRPAWLVPPRLPDRRSPAQRAGVGRVHREVALQAGMRRSGRRLLASPGRVSW